VQKPYNNIYEFTCGVVNVYYLTDNNRKSQLDAALLSYNISCIV